MQANKSVGGILIQLYFLVCWVFRKNIFAGMEYKQI